MFLNGFIKKLKCGFWLSLADLLKHVANSSRGPGQKLSVPGIPRLLQTETLNSLVLSLFISVKAFIL